MTISTLDVFDVSSLSEGELRRLSNLLAAELEQRAVRDSDPAALVAEGFEVGFDRRNQPHVPEIVGGLIRAYGALNAKSRSSHHCEFPSVDGRWIWEVDDLVHEEVRKNHQAFGSLTSVSLIPAHEGLIIDMLSAVCRGGIHSHKGAKSFQVVNGELVPVATRVKRPTARR